MQPWMMVLGAWSSIPSLEKGHHSSLAVLALRQSYHLLHCFGEMAKGKVEQALNESTGDIGHCLTDGLFSS